LKKGIKIKTFTVLLAWLVLFAHSIVPHNHLQEQNCGFKSFIHDFCLVVGTDKCELNIGTPGTDNEKVCHFTNNLFHQLNSDVILVASDETGSLNNSDEKNFFMLYEKDQVAPDYILYPNSLRAPPLLLG
jgi:hypothetical protein